jgi:hypothetical protein
VPPLSPSQNKRFWLPVLYRWFHVLVAVAATSLLWPSLALAADVGDIRGVVHDAAHRPIATALLELKSVRSEQLRTATSSRDGEFSFPSVALGDYVLTVKAEGYATEVLSLTVTAGAAPYTHIQLTAGSTLQTVTVSASALPSLADTFTPTTLVSRNDIELTPGAERTNSLAMITDFVPGAYLVHDQLHVRGGHQVTWAVDGVEIPNTDIGSNLGPQIDPKDIDFLEIEGGSYGADEGDRTYGVFNVVPRNGFERTSQGDLMVSGGNFGQTNDSLSIGSHTSNFAYYASAAGNRSNLGLMTPVAQIIHDADDGYSAFTTLIYNDGAQDQLRAVASARHDDYQIPNAPGQIADDAQREADNFAVLSWVHTFNRQTTLTSSLLYHYNRADYDGASGDYPISTVAQRSSNYAGGQESFRMSIARNDMEAGLYGFYQWDDRLFHLKFNDLSNPEVLQALHATGSVTVAFAQDTYRATDWLSLSAGIRATAFSALIHENATDPRLGVVIKIPGWSWVIRGFYGRYYQPPPLETISGPLLQYAQNSNLAFLPLRGERDRELQYGLTVPIAGWRLSVDHFRTQADNFFDHNPIGSSDVFLPITITGARIEATEVAVHSPRFWAGPEVYMVYSNQTADGIGTITGGLTDFSPPAGSYALDHDQRNTIGVGFNSALPWHLFTAVNLSYGSGFSNGAEGPSHLASHASLDLSIGRHFSESLTGSVSVLNLANRHLLIDNSLTFGGIHYDYPREIYAEVHYRFGY